MLEKLVTPEMMHINHHLLCDCFYRLGLFIPCNRPDFNKMMHWLSVLSPLQPIIDILLCADVSGVLYEKMGEPKKAHISFNKALEYVFEILYNWFCNSSAILRFEATHRKTSTF